MAKQIPNACVTSIMEYANNKVFGGTVNEGAYILYYTQTYNSNPLIDGVSLDYIEPFVTHFFKTQTFTNYKSAIDAKHPVMTDVNSQIESSAHNVLCVGYNSIRVLLFIWTLSLLVCTQLILGIFTRL